ncbi:hypothetical protein NQZ68_012112 [Dissostichus eleginoides]|nr:hypothetical protein NQZ68_012112 [Dissostichus eleginoides]
MVRLSRHARGGGRAAGNASGSSLGQRSARMEVGIARYPGDERCATNLQNTSYDTRYKQQDELESSPPSGLTYRPVLHHPSVHSWVWWQQSAGHSQCYGEGSGEGVAASIPFSYARVNAAIMRVQSMEVYKSKMSEVPPYTEENISVHYGKEV